MSKRKELIECVKLLLWELEQGYTKETKEEINQRIERIKEFNNFKDYVREMENDEHEKYIIETTDMYLKDRDWKSKSFKGKKEFEYFSKFNKPKQDEYKIQALIDSAGAFAAGAERLDNTAMRLNKLVTASESKSQFDIDKIESMVSELDTSFEQFQKAEEKFGDELK